MSKKAIVLTFIKEHPGTTAERMCRVPVISRLFQTYKYGSHKGISSIVSILRREGKVRDVDTRCPACGQARTRGHRNVELYAI